MSDGNSTVTRGRGRPRSNIPRPDLPAWMDRTAEHHEFMALPRARLLKRVYGTTERWYYAWDGRPFYGDRMLGSNPVVALRKYKELEAHRAAPAALLGVEDSRKKAGQLRVLAKDSVEVLRLLVAATGAKPKPGVYFLLGAGAEILYVGKSDNVLNRMAGHKEKEFESVRMMHIPEAKDRDRIEAHLIRLLMPPLNVVLVKAGKATQALLEADSH